MLILISGTRPCGVCLDQLYTLFPRVSYINRVGDEEAVYRVARRIRDG